ncbi:D-glycero-beta-D-manno-heptose 1,7-bisphosphate 7-phosphatase [Natronospira bacteriovora]|uniref:D,D-heptose 1,7-bisphosphate phosphatase n=1 Tax=Natronospira bacteriovora TaxID=3069753 RepID=A0ABU0W765_9GAMM|nr:D-glycero-beta-D-manno-heptose 1,7-bisphosphate 7-phosphatase [Natronospira sp. AB-CW4]MDQ2069797.1 D-glycero-beta-D-manno-heptose 1,7-bisphosphate 7-phosphatase [Natronospira sp. AB-CW4]
MRLVILDRDGTINEESDDYIKSPEEWHALPGALEAIARLNRGGWRVVVASNQSGLGRGLFTPSDLLGIHHKIQGLLQTHGGEIDAFFFCPHHPDDACGCRKPAPGMLKDISKRFQTALSHVPMIGDSEKDVEVARNAGARPMLVLTGRGRETLERLRARNALDGVEVFDDLAAAANTLLAEHGEEEADAT